MNIIKVLPGLILSTAVAYSGIFLSEWLGFLLGFSKSPISAIIVSIVLGILISNLFKLSEVFSTGFEFSTKRVLRFGIILLGIRLSLSDVFYHATIVLPLITGCIVITLIATYYIARKLNIGLKFALLTAIGTSICGATAIVATSPVIHASKEETSYAIANVTLFGILAMLVYPYFGHAVFISSTHIGYFLGTAIHETAQVAGAGLIYAQQYNDNNPLDVSTITKLTRNSLMLVLIPCISFIYYRNHKEQTVQVSLIKLFPLFIIGFLLTSLFRTIGDNTLANSEHFLGMNKVLWEAIIGKTKLTAEWLLTIAMSAIGLSTHLKSLLRLGVRPLYLGLIVSLIAGLISFLLISLTVVLGIF